MNQIIRKKYGIYQNIIFIFFIQFIKLNFIIIILLYKNLEKYKFYFR
jgi:hypothetical protein